MIVTTEGRPSEATVERAHALADELDARYVPRSTHTLSSLCSRNGVREVLVVGSKQLKLHGLDNPPFFFHPSMALIRAKRLREGGNDALVEASGAAPGDIVLDCTAGLCSDSLVLSYAVGPKGRVLAMEAARTTYVVVREGLRTYETGMDDVDEALRAIEIVHGRYEELLAGMPDKSADIVYFDPMFEIPVDGSSSIAPLRGQAIHQPLGIETVRHATRVARKKVVLKDHRDSGKFRALGFALARKSYSSVAYGVINLE